MGSQGLICLIFQMRTLGLSIVGDGNLSIIKDAWRMSSSQKCSGTLDWNLMASCLIEGPILRKKCLEWWTCELRSIVRPEGLYGFCKILWWF